MLLLSINAMIDDNGLGIRFGRELTDFNLKTVANVS